MILLTLLLFLCTSTINEASSVMPAELPMVIEDGNWLIKARLVEEKSFLEANIIEYIVSIHGTIRGRIDFKIGDDAVKSIFYTNKQQDKRLIFDDHSCSLYEYSYWKGWEPELENHVNRYLFKQFLFAGPSIIFRIAESKQPWKPAADEVIRGFRNHVAKKTLSDEFDAWFYFKGNNYETGIKKPNQVTFIIQNSRRYNWQKEYFYYYIYTNTRVEQNFDTIVTPVPTAYCQQSLIDSLGYAHEPFPRITEHSIHFISKTSSFNAGPSKKEEIYADEKYQILSTKISTYGKDNALITTDIIYDYQLGIQYEFTEEGNCSVSPMKLSAPGLIQDSSLAYGIYKLDLNRLLNFNLNYRYFGPAILKNRIEIGTHAWQLSEQQAKVDKTTYEYVVTTQYLNKLADSSGYTLVGTQMNAYDTKYNLTASRTTEYFFYQREMDSLESMSKFNVRNCYPDLESKRTFAMYFTCKDNPCDYFEQHYNQFEDKVKDSLINSGTVAASRIASIESIFNSNEIIVYITILDFPRIKDAFQMRNMKLDEKTLTAVSKVKIHGDEEDCLMKNSNKYEPFEAIAFCKTGDDNLCQRIDGKNSKLVEDQDNGISCSVFMTPLKNLYRYTQEIPLENIHEKLNHISISFESPQHKMFIFTPYHVTDVTKVNDNEHSSLFDSIYRNMKLIEDGMMTISVTGASDSSSCYRKCVNSVENNCNSFSFCVYKDKVECLVSNNADILPQKTSFDTSCITYTIENLQKFKKIPSKRFTDIQKSVSFDSSLGKCAYFCYNSDSCKSFQFCSGSCSMAGHYTDAASDYSEECDIYIPKALDKFKVTGKMIVEDVFHTERNLDADQCAALCHDWKDKEVTCQSFNYCPANAKKQSICELSKHDSSHDADVKLVHSDTCQNYERKKQSLFYQHKSIVSKSPHIGTVFSAIAIFGTSGLILGVIVAIGITKFYFNKKDDVPNNRHTFGWKKQMNDED